MTALRTLRQSDKALNKSMERLSTGTRIARAADDPSGMVISEQLRGQIRGLEQAFENSQNASNLLGTAEAALTEVQDLLVGLRDSVLFAMNTGGNSPAEIQAEQDSVDAAIVAINRIANTTRFADRSLLNGAAYFNVTAQDINISELKLRSVQFPSDQPLTFDIDVNVPAYRASAGGFSYSGAAQTQDAILRVSGNLGSEDINIPVGMTDADFEDAIDAMTWNTGVWASTVGAGDVRLYSLEYGEDQFVTAKAVKNDVDGAALTEGSTLTGNGTDLDATVDGADISARGNHFTVSTGFLSAEVTMDDATVAGTYSFTVAKSGLTFQLNGGASLADRETIGIQSVDPSLLGAPERTLGTSTLGGYLTSLKSGGDNDLFSNPENALRIIDEAINDVSGIRAYIGSFQAFTIDPNSSALEVNIENLTASESSIRDLDYAKETSEFTRTQILFQAGTAVLAQANLIPQSVLTLLQ
jgi:flagellin